jgi:Ax21 family sulfation-dependent quorum factor
MKRSLIALALLAAAPFAASASDLSYNYIEGGYTRVNGVGAKIDGAVLNGSIALGSRFHAFGGYEALDLEATAIDIGTGQTFSADADFDTWTLGFGYNHSLTNSTDLVARVGYRNSDIDVPGFDLKSYFTEVGARAQLATNFEGYAYAGYERTEGAGDGDYFGRIGGQYSFNRNWGLVADVKFGQSVEQYFVGPRFTF